MSVKNPSNRDMAKAAERSLASGYTLPRSRPSLAALFALDERLGDIVRTTREPIVGQMRLTWWHDALHRLDAGPAPAEPVLVALAEHVIAHGVSGADLAQMIDGWEALLDRPTIDEEALLAHATGRGAVLFGLAGRLAGSDDEPLATAGEGWALADLAANLSQSALVAVGRRLATDRLAGVMTPRWSRPTRGLGALAVLARMDVADGERPPGHPLRIARLLRHRLTGH